MTTSQAKKHPCPDCRQCQNCAPARCHLCRGQGADAGERRFAGLSIAQQIALFEAVQRGQAPEGDYGRATGACGGDCGRPDGLVSLPQLRGVRDQPTPGGRG